MRKKLLTQPGLETESGLNLEDIASFEISSEDENHPLESVIRDDSTWWQAAEEGRQTMKLLFDSPQKISRIVLLFEEHFNSRTQEFSVWWQAQGDSIWRELRRQQYNFGPPETTTEREDFEVSLEAAVGIKLIIDPALDGTGKAKLTWLGIVAPSGA